MSERGPRVLQGRAAVTHVWDMRANAAQAQGKGRQHREEDPWDALRCSH